ncbi:MAG: hypothetical protein GY757_18075 [bacterium]|nr:hypothetical protein [bacterium]
MKNKRFKKKLSLRKSTVSHLNLKTLDDVKGGITATCYSEDPDETCTITIPPSVWGPKTKCMFCVP